MKQENTAKTLGRWQIMLNKRKEMTSGNLAFAEAMRQVNHDVVAAYPITPSTEIPVKLLSLLQTAWWIQSMWQ